MTTLRIPGIKRPGTRCLKVVPGLMITQAVIAIAVLACLISPAAARDAYSVLVLNNNVLHSYTDTHTGLCLQDETTVSIPLSPADASIMDPAVDEDPFLKERGPCEHAPRLQDAMTTVGSLVLAYDGRAVYYEPGGGEVELEPGSRVTALDFFRDDICFATWDEGSCKGHVSRMTPHASLTEQPLPVRELNRPVVRIASSSDHHLIALVSQESSTTFSVQLFTDLGQDPVKTFDGYDDIHFAQDVMLLKQHDASCWCLFNTATLDCRGSIHADGRIVPGQGRYVFDTGTFLIYDVYDFPMSCDEIGPPPGRMARPLMYTESVLDVAFSPDGKVMYLMSTALELNKEHELQERLKLYRFDISKGTDTVYWTGVTDDPNSVRLWTVSCGKSEQETSETINEVRGLPADMDPIMALTREVEELMEASYQGEVPNVEEMITLFIQKQEDTRIDASSGYQLSFRGPAIRALIDDPTSFALLLKRTHELSYGDFYERKAASAIAREICRYTCNDEVIALMDRYLDSYHIFDNIVGCEMYHALVEYNSDGEANRKKLIADPKRHDLLKDALWRVKVYADALVSTVQGRLDCYTDEP